MARIPIAEVPNAPQFTGAPQLAKYPDIPTIRASYQTQRAEPINYRVDMSQEIAALQQKPLPGGFEEGLNRAAEAKGKEAWAQANLTKTIGNTMVTATNAISNVLIQAQEKSLQSKDRVDAIRLNEQLELAKPAFEAEMIRRKIPESQWPEMWRTEGAPKLLEGTSSLGVTQLSRDMYGVRTNSFIKSTEAHYELEVAQKSLRNDIEFVNGTIKRGLEPGGDLNAAQKANDTALALQYINKDSYEDNKRAIQRGRNNNFANETITINPKYARDQASLALEGKETEKGFQFMKDDKAAATTVYNAATQEWNRRRGEAQTTILNDVLDGGKPIGADEITKRGREAGLDEKDIAALKKAAEVPIAFDPKATSDATSAVENYRNEARSDNDMSRRNAIYNQIISTTSPEIQKLLTGELDGIWKNRNDPGTSQQKELGETYQMIDQYSKSGLLVGRDKEGNEVKLPSGLGTKEGEKTKIVDEKAFQAAEQRRSDLYFAAQAYVKDHPDYKAGELKKYINGLAAPDAQRRADDAPLSGMPAPPRPTFHRAEPTPGQVTQWKYGTGTQPTQMQQGAATFPMTGTPTQREMDERVKERSRLRTSAPFERATVGGERHEGVLVTNYTPGKGDPKMEGGNEVKDRKGVAYTVEDYREGKTPWVSVAVDEGSELRGKFLVSTDPEFQGIVFKAEDIGSALKGKGTSQVDVAWRDENKAGKDSKTGATFVVTDEATAKDITANPKTASVGGLNIKQEIDPNYAAMQRPRDVSAISKIVVHGDVKTSVPDLIAYAKQVDRGYHYYIARDGSITEVVPPDHIANHIKGANSDSIGIVIAGADNGKMPTAAQDHAAKQLISSLGKQYGIDPQNVAGHGERQPNRRDVREGGNVARDIRENGYM